MLVKAKKILHSYQSGLFFKTLLLILAVLPSLPVFRFLLASSMALHMLVQIPLLVIAGCFLNPKRIFNKNTQSIYFYLGCWLWILFTSMFWMLPISLDKALLNYYWDIFKILTLLISGYLLMKALSGPKILSLFFIGSMVMMLFFIGYYYQDTDLRLCNSYLLESQKATGNGLMVLAFFILCFAIYAARRSLFYGLEEKD